MIAAGATLSLFLGAADAKGQVAAQWLNPVSGEWENPGLWSTDPVFPNNGSPGPGDLYDVTIDAAGSPYQVLVDGSHPVVNSLLIDSPDAMLTIESGRRFTAVNGLTVHAGVFQLAAGQLHDTTTAGNGLIEILRPEFGNQTAEFVNVILGTELAIQTNNSLKVTGGLHLQGSTITLNSSNSPLLPGFAGLYSVGDFALTGTGELRFSQVRDNQDGGVWASSGLLEIGEDIAIYAHGGSGSVGAVNGTMHNAGLISVDQGNTLEISAGAWQNSGQIRAANGSMLVIQGDIQTADFGDLTATGGSVLQLEGALDNTGGILAVGDTIENVIMFAGFGETASITGGEVDVLSTGTLVMRGNSRLDNVLLRGLATSLYTAEIRNGLELDDAVLTGSFGFTGDQTISGQGQFIFDESVQQAGSNWLWTMGTGASLTLESGVDIVTAGSGGDIYGADSLLTLRGSLTASHAMKIQTSLTNEGTILVNDNILRLDFFDGHVFSNAGLIQVDPDGRLIIESTAGTQYNHTGQFVVNGGILEFIGEMTTSGLGEIQIQSGEARLRADIELNDSTFDLDQHFLGGLPSFRLGSTVFRNGTVQTSISDGLLLDSSFDGVTLQNVILDTDIHIVNSNRIEVIDDLTITAGSQILIGGASAGNSSIGSIQGNAPAAIDGPGEIVLSGFDISRALISHPDITFGPSLTIRTQNGSGTIGRDGDRVWENQGTIRVSGPSDTLLLTGLWDNNGLIDVAAGTLLLGGNMTPDSYGTITRAPDAEIRMTGALDIDGGVSDLDSLGIGDLILAHGASISNGTVSGEQSILRTQDLVQTGVMLDNVTLATDFVIASRGRVSAPAGLTLQDATIFIGTEDVGAGFLSVGLADNRFITGNGDIVFDGATTHDELAVQVNGTGRFLIDEGITVRTGRSGGLIDYGQGGMDLAGTLSAETDGAVLRVVPYLYTSPGKFQNTGGVLRAVDGGTLDIMNFEGNLGQIQTANGGKVSITGSVVQDLPLALDQGGWLQLEGAIDLTQSVEISNGSRLSILGPCTSTEAIVVHDGTLELSSLPSGESPLPTFTAGRFILRGGFSRSQLSPIDLSQTVLELGESSDIDNTFGLLDAGGSIGGLEMSGGRVWRGVIRSADATPLSVTGGNNELAGVLLFDDLHLRGGEMQLTDGTVVAGQILIDPVVGAEAHVTLAGGQGLAGVSRVEFSNGSQASSSLLSNAATFLIEENQEIVTSQNGRGRFGSIGGAMLNRGLISAAGESGYLRVLSREIYNTHTGQIVAEDGATVLIEAGIGAFNRGELFSNNGLVSVKGQGSLMTINASRTKDAGRIEVVGGQLHLLGDFDLSDTSEIVLQLSVENEPAFGVVRVNDDVSFDGRLAVTLEQDGQPTFGDRFQLFTAQNFSGVFSEIVLPDITGIWDQSLLETHGLLQVISIDGDLNGDGFVGVADLDVVLANWGQPVPLGDRISGDQTGDGLVDDADLQVVIDHWGSGTLGDSDVPEPGALACFLMALGVASCRRRTRH